MMIALASMVLVIMVNVGLYGYAINLVFDDVVVVVVVVVVAVVVFAIRVAEKFAVKCLDQVL